MIEGDHMLDDGNVNQGPSPLYAKVKRYLLDGMESGTMAPQSKLPSEHELVRLLGVSRMTVNRALRELADKGLVTRVPGVGTFVADPKPHPGLVEIVDIAEEIESRGHRHSARVVELDSVKAPARVAEAMGFKRGQKLFHSLIVHSENGTPVQLEERFVNPAIGPAYLDQDFTRITPYQYLQSTRGFTDAEHTIVAVRPEPTVQELLGISADEPCLRIIRRTWVSGVPGTFNYLTYPSSRYVLGARISSH